MNYERKIDRIVTILKKRYNVGNIDYAIVAGSGLMESIPELDEVQIVSYQSLGMPKSKVQGHSGKFVFGKLGKKNIVVVSRYHFYESGNMNLVRMPFEIISKLGVNKIILLTSCGGLNKTFKVGDIMLISDHINYTGQNPLIAISPLEFTPMANAYDKEIFNKMKKIADENNIDVREGVHIQFLGPSYETRAEVELASMVVADTVSMSTVFDCIICNYLKIKVAGIASVVNVFTSKDNEEELNHQEVLDNAKNSCLKIKTIIENLIKE